MHGITPKHFFKNRQNDVLKIIIVAILEEEGMAVRRNRNTISDKRTVFYLLLGGLVHSVFTLW